MQLIVGCDAEFTIQFRCSRFGNTWYTQFAFLIKHSYLLFRLCMHGSMRNLRTEYYLEIHGMHTCLDLRYDYRTNFYLEIYELSCIGYMC